MHAVSREIRYLRHPAAGASMSGLSSDNTEAVAARAGCFLSVAVVAVVWVDTFIALGRRSRFRTNRVFELPLLVSKGVLE